MAGRGGGQSSCSIFVGNLPYDAVEAELKEIFSKAGQVNAVRVVTDRDTKQPKGYAFVDYVDSSSVQIAIDKLTNHEYNGRKLRVDGAERELNVALRDGPEGGGPGKGGGRGPPGKGGPPGPNDPPLMLPPPMPTIQERIATLREQEALDQARQDAADQAERAEVARLMETLTPLQLLHLVGEMQRLAISAPDVARALVGENMQLALALQHAEFLVGLLEDPALPTDPEVKERAKSVREILWKGGAPAMPAQAQQPGQPGQPQVVAALVPGFGAPQAGFGRIQVPGQPTALAPGGMAPMIVPQTVMPLQQQQQMGYKPSPAMGGAVNASGPYAAPGADPAKEQHRRALLERLVQLSPAQIDQLPHDQKVQLLDFLQTLPPT